MICPVCGNEIKEITTRCPYCGAKISIIAKSNNPSKIVVYNLEKNMPTCAQAEKMLYHKIFELRKSKTKVLKIIHGYGSSGIGGELRYCMREYLDTLIKRGFIKFYVAGENFRSSFPNGKKLISTFKWITKDSDYNRKNKGITLIVL